MRVHHLDCATMCPLGGARISVDCMVGHCLLVEAPTGLVLVDTGFGTKDATGLRRTFRWVAGPRLEPGRTAVEQVKALGFDPRDVRDIVVTHLDLDHAGGLPDFPEARVHVQTPEHEDALARRGLRDRLRYVPHQWAHGPRWVLHEAAGEPWRGFDAVRAIPGLPPEILLIPLGGHTRGHQGVAVQTERGWLLHAGDLYAHFGRMEEQPWAPWGLALFERGIAHDFGKVVANQARVRALVREHGDVRVFSAHDAVEFTRLAGVAPRV